MQKYQICMLTNKTNKTKYFVLRCFDEVCFENNKVGS